MHAFYKNKLLKSYSTSYNILASLGIIIVSLLYNIDQVVPVVLGAAAPIPG